MICPNFSTGWPLAIGLAAILWPRITLLVALMPCAVTPGITVSMATMMLSLALSRSVRGAFFSGLSCIGASRCFPHDAEPKRRAQ